MKSQSLVLGLLALSLSFPSARSGEILIDQKNPVVDTAVDPHQNLWDPHRPDSHAPIGVMAEHTHEAGEFMLSYRYMYMDMQGMRDGTDDLSSQQVFQRGYMATPTTMDMEMHMIGGMFAPTDSLTLMLMGNYQFRNMDFQTRPGSMARRMQGSNFRQETEGWGDLTFGGLLKIYDDRSQRIHLNLLASAPVGEFNDRPYSMQPTTGTWDLLPGITWLWQANDLSGGAQVKGRIHLGENERDYSFGDSVEGTTWLAYRLADGASISGRVTLEYDNDINGEDRRFRGLRMAPPMDPANHGGTWLEGAIGLNLYGRQGLAKGHRLAIEALYPIYQDLNGPQMQRDWSLVVGWQKAF